MSDAIKVGQVWEARDGALREVTGIDRDGVRYTLTIRSGRQTQGHSVPRSWFLSGLAHKLITPAPEEKPTSRVWVSARAVADQGEAALLDALVTTLTRSPNRAALCWQREASMSDEISPDTRYPHRCQRGHRAYVGIGAVECPTCDAIRAVATTEPEPGNVRRVGYGRGCREMVWCAQTSPDHIEEHIHPTRDGAIALWRAAEVARLDAEGRA